MGAALLVLLSGLPAAAGGQAPVKADLMLLFGKVPSLPANSSEAHAGFPARFDDMLKTLDRERMRITSGGATGTASMEQLARQAESMSDAQRMQMAMQMAQRQTSPTPGQDPPSVMEALVAYGELTSRLGADQQGDIEYQQYWDERLSDLWRTFTQMDDSVRSVIRPEMTSGAIKAIQLNTWQKKDALFSGVLAAARIDFTKRMAVLKERVTPFNEALRHANWGSGAVTPTVVMSLGQGQLQITGAVDELVRFSHAHWKMGKELWDLRLEILR